MSSIKVLPQNRFFSIMIVMMLFFSAAASLVDSWNPISLYIVLPAAFMISFMQEMKVIVNKYFKILVVLYLWILFTTLFSYDVEVSMLQLKQILGCALLCYIISAQVKNDKIIPWMYIVFIILYLGALNYAINYIIPLMAELGGKERVNDDRLNANTLAYYTFYATYALFILGEIIRNKKMQQLFKIAFFVIIPLSFWIAIITASRQVLILQVPLIMILLYLRYMRFGNIKSKLFIIVLMTFIIAYFANSIIQQFEGSFLAERSQIAVNEDDRFVLVEETIELGLNNFLVGVGPGCVRFFTSERAFAHNTFLELFAGTGIVGMLIFVYLLITYFKRQIRRYKQTKDKMFVYFIVFGCFFVLDQMFYVFYSSLWLIGFFMLVACHSEMYIQKIRK